MRPRIDLKELARRESEQVEWKEDVSDVADLVRTLVAFANDWSNLGGGYVVCGVREGKDAHGFQKLDAVGLSASRFKEIEGAALAVCREFVEPPIVPLVEELPSDVEGWRVLVFVIAATSHAHTLRTKVDSGKYFVRISRETREARNGLMRELLVRKSAREPWDHLPHAKATVEDLDLLVLRDALQQMKVWDPARSVEDFLSETRSLSSFVPSLCVKEPLSGTARPRNATILLFGRDVQRFVPGAYSVVSVYPGTDRSEPHSTRRMIEGNILHQTRQLLDVLDAQAVELLDKTNAERPNGTKYPRRALHEALVNAVAHRDYTSVEPSRVTIFRDHVEFFSPGTLPSGIDAVEFASGQAPPRWRNQMLAWFFNRLQFAQAEDQAIPTILRTMENEGCPPPTFQVTTDSVTCVLRANPRHLQFQTPSSHER